jgi:hypothetical protein
MSAGARWTLGSFMVAFAAMFAWLPLGGLIPQNAWICYAFAGLCFLIAVACVPGRHEAIVGRTLAGAACAFSVSYLVYEHYHPGVHTGQSSADPQNALLLFLLWGLPSGIYAAFGKAPSFGRLGRTMVKIKEANDRKA